MSLPATPGPPGLSHNDDAPPGLILLGASHRTAPLAVRERLALGPDKLDRLVAGLRALSGLREFVVLSTCNRVEIYGMSAEVGTLALLQERLAGLQAFTAEELAGVSFRLHGRDAIQHLLEVAAGLDSQMIGETEILGQVKDAYADAQRRATVGAALNRIFQKTFQAAKHVRTHTAIGQGQVSAPTVAVELAQKIFGGLARTHILVLGAGDIGEKTATAFKSRGAAQLTVASRTLAGAQALAEALGGRAIPFEEVGGQLAQFDIAVCSTAAPGHVLGTAMIGAAMKKRAARPLFLIDLALPRDVEASAASLPNVFLYNLDDLAKIAGENLALRQAEIARSRTILSEKADALWKQVVGRADAG